MKSSAAVKYAYCTCKARKGGWCNHMYALMKVNVLLNCCPVPQGHVAGQYHSNVLQMFPNLLHWTLQFTN